MSERFIHTIPLDESENFISINQLILFNCIDFQNINPQAQALEYS